MFIVLSNLQNRCYLFFVIFLCSSMEAYEREIHFFYVIVQFEKILNLSLETENRLPIKSFNIKIMKIAHDSTKSCVTSNACANNIIKNKIHSYT